MDAYSALHREIASLSLDPYPLSNEDLSEIMRIRESLAGILLSESDDKIISSLFAEIGGRLRSEYEGALTARDKRKKILSDLYHSLLEAFSCFLSASPLNKTMTVWFSPLTEAERYALKDAILVFTSKCAKAQTRLIALDAAEGADTITVILQKELLTRKIALLLSFPNQRDRIISEIDRLSDLSAEIESLKCKEDELTQAALCVAVELLPPFLEDLHPVLVSPEKGSLPIADTTDVRRIFLNTEGLREQIRETLEPIIK